MQILGHERGTAQALLAPLADVDIKLRWGAAQVPDAINGRVHLLNGLEQLTRFRAAGVPTPDFTASLVEAEGWVRNGDIVLGRSLWHTQGKDIVLPGDRRWRARDYWVKYWCYTSQEWRFHILFGRSIGRGQKRYTGPTPEELTKRPSLLAIRKRATRGINIRSRRLGWTIDHTAEPPEICRETAKAAAYAVGYELGAVDLLYGDAGNGQDVRVLEINSRPAIRDNYTIEQYSKYLRRFAEAPPASKWRRAALEMRGTGVVAA